MTIAPVDHPANLPPEARVPGAFLSCRAAARRTVFEVAGRTARVGNETCAQHLVVEP